ncbi:MULTISPECIES: hypothetical protein [Priestia]|uniref:hypothetical protein n=1 Tax=Priestia TaxID=2800373 RepID=UPI0003085E20|nr:MULTISPECIES: hypothetical protein [Priestia]RAS89103.1 hypothetical protein A4U60_04635 [Priestia endophytica]
MNEQTKKQYKMAVLNLLQPKIASLVKEAHPVYQEDLEQELKLKMLEKMQTPFLHNIPSFFEFVSSNEKK